MAARDGTQLTGQETAEVAFGNVGLLYLASKHYSRSAVHAQPTAVRLREPSKTRDIFFQQPHRQWGPQNLGAVAEGDNVRVIRVLR